MKNELPNTSLSCLTTEWLICHMFTIIDQWKVGTNVLTAATVVSAINSDAAAKVADVTFIDDASLPVICSYRCCY